MINRDNRKETLKQWLVKHIETPYTLVPASEDASFRSYYRVQKNNDSWIVMDAPPDHEDIQAFVTVSKQLEALSLHVPHVFDFDLEYGFALLSDLGCSQYLSALRSENADQLYQDALNALFTIQTQAKYTNLPNYDQTFLRQELEMFSDWFLKIHLRLTLDNTAQSIINDTFDKLIHSALQQPCVFVHRDYHSRNLMFCKKNNPGILDFQGALAGPITYDLVSLLRDCYIEWPDSKVDHWLDNYHQRLTKHNMIDADIKIFKQWFDYMGLQRHLKVLGIFSRLNYRDQKPHYMQNIPTVLNYIKQVSQRYDELQPFYDQIQKIDIEFQAH